VHKTKLATVCVLFLIPHGCSQNARQSRPSYTAPGGEFSFVPPEQWVMRTVPGFKHQFAFGQRKNDFTQNINFVDTTMPVKLDDFVTSNLQALQQVSQKEGRPLNVLSQTEFTTEFKQRAVKVVTETEYYGKPLRQTFYYIEAKDDKKFVVTCSVLAEDGESYDKIFDSSLRTFKTGG